ncbi:MAG: acetate--CoA ligase family protein, partial [Thermoplasmata archaeon]
EKSYKDIPDGLADEVILVDDQSRDKTVKIAKKLGLTVFIHPNNLGYGGNQKTCYWEALKRKPDVVIMLHPDYQYDATLMVFATVEREKVKLKEEKFTITVFESLEPAKPSIDEMLPKVLNPGLMNTVAVKIKNEGRNYVTEVEAKEILAAYKIPVAKTLLAKNKEEAIQLSKNLKYPLVAKIVSPQIIHKSDVGGVVLNIKNEIELEQAYDKIMNNVKKNVSNAEILGIALQEMAPQGVESIIGSTKDIQFGPTVMFGLGGIFVEIMKDVSFRIAPFSKSTAIDMINELNGKSILYGVRGEKPKDIESLSDAISRISQLVTEFPEIKELDANPTLVYENGICVVDARIILEKK